MILGILFVGAAFALVAGTPKPKPSAYRRRR
jgi:hypothetical protein